MKQSALAQVYPNYPECALALQGTLTPEDTIILDVKPALPPGRVSVRVEPIASDRWAEIDRLVEKNAILYPGPDVGMDIISEMRESRHFQGDE